MEFLKRWKLLKNIDFAEEILWERRQRLLDLLDAQQVDSFAGIMGVRGPCSEMLYNWKALPVIAPRAGIRVQTTPPEGFGRPSCKWWDRLANSDLTDHWLPSLYICLVQPTRAANHH